MLYSPRGLCVARAARDGRLGCGDDVREDRCSAAAPVAGARARTAAHTRRRPPAAC